jgi:hypothetical protein
LDVEVENNSPTITQIAIGFRCLRKVHLNAHLTLHRYSIESNENSESNQKKSTRTNLPQFNNCPAIKQALNFLQCSVKSVRLMCLKVGAEIKPHTDNGLNVESREALTSSYYHQQ